MNKALANVEKIDPKDFVEVRGFSNPPAAVKMVMEAVCCLLGKTQDWATAKTLMQDLNGFFSSLKNYNKDNIPENRLV